MNTVRLLALRIVTPLLRGEVGERWRAKLKTAKAQRLKERRDRIEQRNPYAFADGVTEEPQVYVGTAQSTDHITARSLMREQHRSDRATGHRLNSVVLSLQRAEDEITFLTGRWRDGHHPGVSHPADRQRVALETLGLGPEIPEDGLGAHLQDVIQETRDLVRRDSQAAVDRIAEVRWAMTEIGAVPTHDVGRSLA